MERVFIIFLWLAVLIVPDQIVYGHPSIPGSTGKSNNFSVFEENGKVGLKDEEGEILIPATYDAIGWSNGKLSIIDKVVGYQSGGMWGLIHTANKIITPAEFLNLKPGEGSYLIAQKRSLSQRPSFGIINTSGKTIVPFDYDGLHLSNMRAIVMSRTGMRYHFGLKDLTGKLLIPLEYQRIYSLGSLRFAVENFDDKIAIFSDDGRQVTEFNIDSISAFKKDYAIVYQNQRQGLINRNGQMVVSPVYGAIELNDDGTVNVRDVDAWFMLDGENKLVTRYEADAIMPLSKSRYAVFSGGKVRLTDNEFKPLHPAHFSSLTSFQRGLALFRSGGRTGVIDSVGKIVIPADYQQIILDESVFRACLESGQKNRWVILDAKGQPLTGKHYQKIDPFNGKYYPVRNRDYWGAVDSHGKEIIACVHDSLLQQKGNRIVVKFKGEYGIISLDEHWLVTPQPNALEIVNDNTYLEFDGKTTFLKSFTRDIIYFSDNRLDYESDRVTEHLPSGASWTIDMNGLITDRSMQPERAEKIFPASEGLRAIYQDGKYGFIDDQGRLRIANRYEAVQPFHSGFAAVRIRDKWGFIDRQEKLVVQPVYDHVASFENGYAIVRQDGFAGLIDTNGRIILPLRYEDITLTDEHRFMLRQEGLYGLADGDGRIIIHPKYDVVTDTGNGYVIVKRNNKFGVLTLRGVSTVPMIYDDLTYDPYRKHYLAMKRSEWKTVNVSASSTAQRAN